MALDFTGLRVIHDADTSNCSDINDCLQTTQYLTNAQDSHPQLIFRPNSFDLQSNSINLNAVHSGNFTELDAHSLYGTSMVKAAFESLNPRTVIIGESSFGGYG